MRKLLILLAATALVVAFTLPAAAEVSFYGDARMNTGWYSNDPDTAGVDTTDNVKWSQDFGCSRLGAKFQDGAVGGHVEIRPLAGAQTRLWYGWWDFGGGKLVVGQAYAPDFAPVGSAAYDCGYTPGYGDVIGSVRVPQIALWMGSLQIAAIEPTQANKLNAAVPGSSESTGMLPKIAANYSLKAGPAAIKLYGGFNSSEEKVLATKKTYDYTSYLFGANVRMAFGAAGLALNIYTAKNPKEYGLGADRSQAAAINAAGTDIDEVDEMGFIVDFNYKISPTMGLYAGFGQVTDELDVAGTSEGTHTLFYVGLPITLAKNVTITPEVGQYSNELDTGAAVTKAPSTTYYGAYWRIAF
jgi:hypothetical protein